MCSNHAVPTKCRHHRLLVKINWRLHVTSNVFMSYLRIECCFTLRFSVCLSACIWMFVPYCSRTENEQGRYWPEGQNTQRLILKGFKNTFPGTACLLKKFLCSSYWAQQWLHFFFSSGLGSESIFHHGEKKNVHEPNRWDESHVKFVLKLKWILK